MNIDQEKTFVKNTMGGGELYKIINCDGVEMYTIEQNGVELLSCNNGDVIGMLKQWGKMVANGVV